MNSFKLSKKLLVSSVILVFTFIFFSLTANAALTGSDYSIAIVDNEAIITSYSGKNTMIIVIPEKIQGYTVTGIDEHVFDAYWKSEYEKISTIILPDTVKTIGECAFRGCKSLITLKLSSELKTIGSGAFCDCSSLTKIVIPDGVTELPDNLLTGCEKLKNVQFSEKVTRIGFNSFSGCTSLESFTVPEGVKEIEWNTFGYCENLKKVSLPDSIVKIDDEAFSCCSSLTDISIPDGVLEIGSGAFFRCQKITNLKLPPALKRIGSSAFSYLGNKSLIIPDGVTFIGESAFDFSEIEEITLPYGLKAIGMMAFYSCNNLKKITIPGTVEVLPEDIFVNCGNLEAVVLENGVKYINNEAFSCSNVRELYIPDSVIQIEEGAFNETAYGLKTIYYSGSKEDWESITVFRDNEMLGKVEIKYNYISPEHNRLKNVKATEASCKNPGYTEGVYCNHCNKWVKGHKIIEVPHKDTNLDRSCDICGSSTLISKGGNGEGFFWELYDGGELIISGNGNIPDESFLSNTDIKKVVIEEGIRYIGIKAFYDCKNLSSVSLPDGLETIGAGAFYSCASLDNVVVPDSVTDIYVDAFRDCSSLKNIKLSKNLKGLKERIFLDCTSLKKITLPEGIEYINSWVFHCCSSLEEIKIPDNVEYIDYGAFENCASLTKAHIGKKTEAIDSRTFWMCPKLRSISVDSENKFFTADNHGVLYSKDMTVLYEHPDASPNTSYTVPDGVTTINDYSFSGCTNLLHITIPTTVKAIGQTAFSDSNLKSVCYAGAKRQWEAVKVYANNDELTSADISYNHKAPHNFKTSTTKATLTENGKEVSKCSACDYTYTATIYHPGAISLSNTSYTYDGNVKTPSVTVKDIEGNVLTQNTDYTVTYADGRKNIGTYTVTVRMIGNYSGTKNLSFEIKLRSESELPGDINGDNMITSVDARLTLRAAVGLENLSDKEKKCADVNKDGKITAADARLILRCAVGLEKL